MNSSMVIHDEEHEGASGGHAEIGKPHEVPKTQGKKSLNNLVKSSLARADSQNFDEGVHLNHGAIGGAFGGHSVGVSLSQQKFDKIRASVEGQAADELSLNK
jgi:hypothetical protein